MSEQEAKRAVSQAVWKAQARLLSMREEYRRVGQQAGRVKLEDGRVAGEECKRLAQKAASSRDFCHAVAKLPNHLGWGSPHLSQALRRSVLKEKQNQQASLQWLDELGFPQPPTSQPKIARPAAEIVPGAEPPKANEPDSYNAADINTAAVKLHPDIGLGMLRSKTAAAGRLWLLLRWLDKTGSGRIETAQMRKLFCEPASAVRICGWRQLRSLIAQGEGVYWVQTAGYLWLRSIPKAAKALGVERLSGRPIALPVNSLTQGMGQVRAHLYSSFHSGRKNAAPISRSALAEVSLVSPRSQQNYEKRTHVRKQKNMAIGPNLASENFKDQIWQHRSACFKWRDKKSVHGAHGKTYLAWQLPNSYLGPHEQRPLGRQRKFNRELAVLFAKGMTGNDQSTVDVKPKRYFDAGKKASWSQGRSSTEVYWRSQDPGIWYFMEALG